MEISDPHFQIFRRLEQRTFAASYGTRPKNIRRKPKSISSWFHEVHHKDQLQQHHEGIYFCQTLIVTNRMKFSDEFIKWRSLCDCVGPVWFVII